MGVDSPQQILRGVGATTFGPDDTDISNDMPSGESSLETMIWFQIPPALYAKAMRRDEGGIQGMADKMISSMDDEFPLPHDYPALDVSPPGSFGEKS